MGELPNELNRILDFGFLSELTATDQTRIEHGEEKENGGMGERVNGRIAHSPTPPFTHSSIRVHLCASVAPSDRGRKNYRTNSMDFRLPIFDWGLPQGRRGAEKNIDIVAEGTMGASQNEKITERTGRGFGFRQPQMNADKHR